jgi:hypothetical protein
MQSLLTSREMPLGDRSPPARYNVVIIYEDSCTRKQAKKGLNCVAEEFGSDFEIRHWMWRLDILQDPKLSVRAAPSLAKSDLLMISLHGARRLSAKIRKLVDEQLVQRVRHGSALLALFEGAASATRSPLYACLSTLAQERGLDFFEQAINEGEDQENPSLKLVWVF